MRKYPYQMRETREKIAEERANETSAQVQVDTGESQLYPIPY